MPAVRWFAPRRPAGGTPGSFFLGPNKCGTEMFGAFYIDLIVTYTNNDGLIWISCILKVLVYVFVGKRDICNEHYDGPELYDKLAYNDHLTKPYNTQS